MFQLRKGVELQRVQVWATRDSLLLKEEWSDNHVSHGTTTDVHFQTVSPMFHDAVQLLWSKYLNVMRGYRTRDMKSGLVGNMMFVRKLESLLIHQSCHGQNCVAMGCPLVWVPAESAPWTCRDTTALREPLAQLLVASATPMKPNELTSLGFGWMPYGCSLPSHQRQVGLLHAISRCSQSPETSYAMLWSSLYAFW